MDVEFSQPPGSSCRVATGAPRAARRQRAAAAAQHVPSAERRRRSVRRRRPALCRYALRSSRAARARKPLLCWTLVTIMVTLKVVGLVLATRSRRCMQSARREHLPPCRAVQVRLLQGAYADWHMSCAHYLKAFYAASWVSLAGRIPRQRCQLIAVQILCRRPARGGIRVPGR